MARSLQLLSVVLSRAGISAPCARSTVTLTCHRFISKGPNIQPWTRHNQRDPGHREDLYVAEGETELEDVEDKIQAVIKQEFKRRQTVKYHMIRRQMTPRGPPERRLTWDAMEKIRYLKQEQPEEWTVERLAEGFAVSKDVILRVLRSKFNPSPQRKSKQDYKVMATLEQQMLPGLQAEYKKNKLAVRPGSAALSSGNGNSALLPAGHHSLMPQPEEKSVALSGVSKRSFLEQTKRSAEMTPVVQQSAGFTDDEEEEDEGWDGQVLSEEDIEMLFTVRAPPVVKEGNMFFDTDGNFLYQI